MAEKNIEVEIRGLLPGNKAAELKEFLEKNGRKVARRERTLIDYSTFLTGEVRDRKKDIRIRITNGVPEIVVKLGSWGGSDQRKELSVKTEPGSFGTLVEVFGALGYEKGIVCIRNSDAYEYEGVEFALVEVPGHSHYFEAEKMAHAGEDIAELKSQMLAVCEPLGLAPFTDQEFFDYIETLNREANVVFDFATEGTKPFDHLSGK